jgi:hypothetical protein
MADFDHARALLELTLTARPAELADAVGLITDEPDLREILYVLAGLARVQFDQLEGRPPAEYTGNAELYRALHVRRAVDDCLEPLRSRVRRL